MEHMKAGWYPDPDKTDFVRYWDGANWSKASAPAPDRAPQSDDPVMSTFDAESPRRVPRRAGLRLVLELVALGFLVLYAGATALGLYRLLGLTDNGSWIGNLVVCPILVVALGYFLYRRSRQYGQGDRRGPVEGQRLHRKTMVIGGVMVGVAALVLAGLNAGSESTAPTLSGSEIQAMMREQLGPVPASGALPRTIACPTSRSYGDGDVARCTMDMKSGAQTLLIATVFRTDGTWRINLDVG